MFKRKSGPEKEIATLEAELADLRRRHAALAAQVTGATQDAEAATVALQSFFKGGDLEDGATRARLEAAALAADGRAAPLRRALDTLAERITAAEQRLGEARERVERERLFADAGHLSKAAVAALERYPGFCQGSRHYPWPTGLGRV